MNTYKWLLKREFWEYRGGFLWAPIIAAVLYLLMSVVGGFVAHWGIGHATYDGDHFDMASLAARASDPKHQADLHSGLAVGFQLLSMTPFVATLFAVFFYCLGCLYDDRKDRSFLFWKSLPVSDAKTVASKVASAAFVAPAIGIAVALATGLLFWILTSFFMLVHGASPAPLWDLSAMASGAANMVLSIPMWALWGLPTIGWLMLCSAWSNRLPFLWAVLSPVVLGVIVSIVDAMSWFGLRTSWYWANIVGRLLGGLVPGIEMAYRHTEVHVNSPQDLAQVFSVANTYAGLANPQLWVGAVIGVAMLLAALRLRKYRAED